MLELRGIDPGASPQVAAALLVVQHGAYGVEARLLGDDRIPPLHETVEELRVARVRWLGAVEDEVLVGAVASTEDSGALDVDRLVVSPHRHRRGVGAALVRAVLDHAGTRRATVSTGRANLPAVRLYRHLGFVELGDAEVLPGLWVTRLEHG